MNYKERELQILIDKTIKQISKSADDKYLRISWNKVPELADNYLYLEGQEDCHIETYWSTIEGQECLSSPILSVGLTDVVETHPAFIDDKGYYSSHEGEIYQAIVLTTLKGRCQIEMRTANVEYYGLSYSVHVNPRSDNFRLPAQCHPFKELWRNNDL